MKLNFKITFQNRNLPRAGTYNKIAITRNFLFKLVELVYFIDSSSSNLQSD